MTSRPGPSAGDTLLDDDPDVTLVLDEGPAWVPSPDSPAPGPRDTIVAEPPAGHNAPTLLGIPAPTVDPTLLRPMTLERPRPKGAGAGGAGSTLPRLTVLPSIAGGGPEPDLVYDGRPRYEHQGLLGEGGMGSVYRAQDNDIDRPVAIKSLHPHMRSGHGMARFTEEIRTVGRLEHPNIVPIHDVGVAEDGGHFFVMRYLAGETLAAIIQKLDAGDPAYHQRYGFERRVEMFMGILKAMHYAHSQGVIHRDLKPANIMVGPHGEVVVMDWGLARTLGQDGRGVRGRSEAAAMPAGRGSAFDKTALGTIMGTPAYMAPEQAKGAAVDERSDTYSLCVLFWELLCLRHYLRDKQSVEQVLAAVRDEEAPIAMLQRHPHQPRVPAELSWFLKHGLEKDPAKRFRSVAEMLDRLRQRADGVIPVQCHITAAKSVTRRLLRQVDRHPMVYTAALTLFGAGVVLLGLQAIF